MAKSSGKVIRYKATPESALSTAKNTGETWYANPVNQPAGEDKDAILKQVLPDLYENAQSDKPNFSLLDNKDLYASINFNTVEPDVTATPTQSAPYQFNQNLGRAKDYYADLPLYDDPNKDKSGEPLRPSSKEEFQKYAKERILSDITGQIKNAGGVGSDISQSALQEMATNTMTASFMKLIGQDIKGLPTDITYDKDGNVLFQGIPLNLTENEKRVINDFNIERTSYHGENDSLLKQAAMFAGSMALDLPLFMLSGTGAGALVSKVPFLAESAAANSVFGRLAGTFAINDIMFNSLSIPRYINIAKGDEAGSILDEVWHNTLFSLGASVFGSAGLGVSKLAQTVFKNGESKIATLINKYPTAFQEASMLSSSFGLGAAFPSDVDRNNQITASDRLVTGLTYAAMHFSNPNAFKTFGREIQNRNIMVDVQDVNRVKTLIQRDGLSLEDAIKQTGIGKDNYYELKDGKLLPIDTDELANNGKIVLKDGATPLDYNKNTRGNYSYINQIEPSFTRTLRDNLNVSRISGLAQDVYGRITKDLEPDYVESNKNLLKNLSWTIATSNEIGSVAEGFRKNRLPASIDLSNKMVDLANNWKLPYSDVEKFVVNNIGSYFANPEDFQNQLQENPLIAKDLDNLMQVASESITKEVQQKTVKDLFDSGVRSPEAIKRILEAELKTKGTVLPSSDVTFFDYNGALLPIKIDEKKGTATISGTDVTMDLNAIKDRTVTKAELKQKQEKVKSEKIKKTDTVEFQQGEKTVQGKVTGFDIKNQSLKVQIPGEQAETIIPIKNARKVSSGQEQVDISQNTENNAGRGERQTGGTETSSSDSGINVGANVKEGTTQPNAQVNEQTPIGQEGTAKTTPIQTTAPENTVQPTTANKEVLVENLRSPEGNQPIKELAQKVVSIPKGQGYDSPELKSNLDAAWEKTKEITNQIGGKAKPGQVFSHLLSNEGLSDEQIAGLYRTKFPEMKVTAGNINDWRNKGVGKDVVGEALKGLKTTGYSPEISSAESTQAGLNPTKATTSTYKSEISDVLPSAMQEMLRNKYDPTNERHIEQASSYGIIDDMQRRALLKNIRSKEAGESSYLDNLLAQKKITQEQYDQAKATGLFKTVSPEQEVITDPTRVESEIQKLQDYMNKSGINIPIQREEGITTPTGEQAAGSYKYGKSLEDDMFRMNTQQTVEGTAPHEWLHFGMNRLGEEATWNRILNEYGGDKEKVADAFAEYARTHKEIDTSTTWGKVKQFFTKIADYFRDSLGWNTKADYFRRLADGQLSLRQIKSATGEEFNKLPEERIKEPLAIDPDEAQKQTDAILSEYEARRLIWEEGKPSFSNAVFKENKLARGIRGIIDKGFNQAAIQVGNYAYQTDGNGNYVHKRFKPFYDNVQSKVINATSVAYNKIIKNPEGWNQNKQVNNMTTPEQNSYLDKIKAYDDAIYAGIKKPLKWEAENGETFDKFTDRVAEEKGFNDREKEAWRRYQIAAREANDIARQGVIDDAKTWLDKEGNRRLTDEETTALADKMFPKFFGDYYNTSRPIQSGYYIIRGFKPKLNAENQVAGEDKFFAYGRNEKDAKRKANEWVAKGYAVRDFIPVNDILRDKRYDKLTANQLLNLADAGLIPKSNEVIQALLDAVKSGRYEQHSINKEYVPGMEYSPREYQESMERLVNEAVSGSVKRFGLQTLRDELGKWRVETERLTSDPLVSEAQKQSVKREYDYALQYYNQVAHSDKSFADAARNLASVYYIGLKPSFWFQQMLQPLQNALPEAIAELKGTNLSATKTWTNAFNTAYELGWVKRAEQKGEKINTTLPQELLDLYDKLDNMRKLGATGIQELMGEAGNADYQYASGLFDKSWKTMVKVANMGGAIAEKYTRLQALSQFYEIGKAKGLEGQQLEDYIVRKIDDVMAQWGAGARPAITNPKSLGQAEQKLVKALSKSFFTFKTYSAANLGQYDRLIRNRQWDALASKMLVGIGMHGITKFPLMATFFGLYNLFSKDDLEYEAIRTLDELNDKVGMKFGTMLSRGVLSAGLGLNMQNLFDERTAFATDVYSMTRSKSAGGRLAEAMLGAPYGVASDVIAGASGVKSLLGQLISSDNMLTDEEKSRAKKNLFQMSPLFIRNVATALSLGQDGVELKGKQLIKADDISWADVLYKMIGFNPLKITETYENQFSGTPAKLARAKGKITELKKIRKDIATSKNYNPLERSNELRKVADLIRQSQKEVALFTKQLTLEQRGRY